MGLLLIAVKAGTLTLPEVNKKELTELGICDLFITPAIKNAGWDQYTQIRREVTLTPGPVIVRGEMSARNKKKKKFADYVLHKEPGVPIAIVEAKDNNKSVSHGLQQALGYAAILEVPSAFSSNGDSFASHNDVAESGEDIETEFPLDQFPSPDVVWKRYKKRHKIVEEELVLQPFKRSGINLHYNTVLDWTNQGLDVLTPLYELLKRRILSCIYLQADETGIKVLDSEKQGSTHQGYLWAYRDVLSNLVLFDYQRGRNKEAPATMLKSFKGFLQTDGYAAYDQFAASNGITTLCCMAHARRYFLEAETNDKQRSTRALLAFQDIYEQERGMKDISTEERQRMRQEVIGPKLMDLHQWMQEEYPKVTPKSPIGKALAYAMKRWRELTEFIKDGRLEIDNNKIENEIRPIALGRKNFLFAGSHESAQRIAMIYSLLASCKVNEIEPMRWLTHVLEELPKRRVNDIEDLLPQKA